MANRIPAVDLDWDPELLKAIGEEVDISDLFSDNEIENLFEKLEESYAGEEDTDDDDTESPAEFKEYDENIDIEHTCPKCGYAWSGGK